MEIFQRTEAYIETNKLTLNTNKTELIFFSRDNTDFGSNFVQKLSTHNIKFADILVIKLTGTLVSMSSQINP